MTPYHHLTLEYLHSIFGSRVPNPATFGSITHTQIVADVASKCNNFATVAKPISADCPPKLVGVEEGTSVASAVLQDLLEKKRKCGLPLLSMDFSEYGKPNSFPESAELCTSDKLDVLNREMDRCLQFLCDRNYFETAALPDVGDCTITLFLHPPVFTCEQAHALSQQNMPGMAMKNLFLKDKKKNLYLVSAAVPTEVSMKNLKLVHHRVENGKPVSGGLRFADADNLWEAMQLLAGSVTPFGLINDIAEGAEGPQVSFFLDKTTRESEYLLFHPNACNATIAVRRELFVHFIEKETRHMVRWVDCATGEVE